MMNYVLFVCGHNAGRSQMAQAFFNHLKRKYPLVDKSYGAISAGTRHGGNINPLVVQVMGEIGIDMDNSEVYFPKGLNEEFVASRGKNVKRVIVACDDQCELPKDFAGIYIQNIGNCRIRTENHSTW